MRFGTYLLTGVVMGIAALAVSCDSLECGQGTHEENGTCVVHECLCGPGTASASTDGGCQCVLAEDAGALPDAGADASEVDAALPLVGAQICPQMVRPICVETIVEPGPCVADTVNPMFVLATTTDDAGRRVLAGGQAVAVLVDGGLSEVRDLANPFVLDGQPARVPLIVETDGTFATDPGAQRFEWPIEMAREQPLLVLRNASVTGALDADGRPACSVHATILGCFSRQNAEAINIVLLGQTFAELLDSGNTAMDCDATGSGATDGYTLELEWVTGDPLDVYD